MPSSPLALKAINIQDLKIGHFVHLPGSWLKHPFLLNQFKIKSQEQIDEIVRLGYTTLSYDPELSDPAALQAPEAPAPLLLPEQDESIELSEKTDPKHRLRRESSQSVKEYQETLRHAYKTYTNMLRHSKAILGHISGGREEGVVLAHEMTSHLAQLLLKETNASAIASLINFKGPDNMVSLHALNVATLSMMVGRELGLNEQELTLLGIGALFHDLGEQRVPTQILAKSTPLSRAERAIFHLHPQYGVEIAGQVPTFPPESLAVIAQHHEYLDGTGYPQGLRGESISRFASIVAVIDTFEQLSNPESPKCLSPSDALSRLYQEQGSHYPGDVVVALIHTMTVYPPGTLVQLTDGTPALVVTVNVQDRLHPVVTLYVPDVPPDDPIIVDLSKNRDLAIARSLRIDEVPDSVQEYLNPRRMTGYFVCALQSQTPRPQP
jgi:putative nucleotidyltransferase with HDIG domain